MICRHLRERTGLREASERRREPVEGGGDLRGERRRCGEVAWVDRSVSCLPLAGCVTLGECGGLYEDFAMPICH